jgi:hypothetical protein
MMTTATHNEHYNASEPMFFLALVVYLYPLINQQPEKSKIPPSFIMEERRHGTRPAFPYSAAWATVALGTPILMGG